MLEQKFNQTQIIMPKYLIERNIPGIGQPSERDIQAIAVKSNRVLGEMGPEIQWQHSYVSDDKLYCLYIATNESLVRQHAEKGDFPLNNIYPVKGTIDPTTGED